jgi:hypothetical protein
MGGLLIAICIALFALGHLFRDGSPTTDSTQIARLGGAFLCGLGALSVLPPHEALIVGLAMLVGFYTDQKHGEGQNARGWTDAAYLALSGFTSLVQLTLALIYFHGPWAGLVALAGLIKPPIWFAAWAVNPARWWTPAYPTRVAAMIFGALIGAVVGAFS